MSFFGFPLSHIVRSAPRRTQRGSWLSSPHGLIVDEFRGQVGVFREALDELLHADALGHLDAVHLEDVLLARADLDEAVLAVGADVGPLAGVDHAVVVERLALLELLLAEVTLDRLLAVCQHVQLEAGLVLVVG